MADDDLTLTPAFTYYYVSHEVWSEVSSQIANDDRHQLQFVAQGSSVYDTAGKAGTWLGRAGKRLTRLVIAAHGGPGSFVLGENVTSKNVAPLGGWLYSFFESDAAGIDILGCTSASDEKPQRIGQYEYGQANPLGDVSLSHQGYNLLRSLAVASRQTVRGALNGQLMAGLRLRSTCRKVDPNGANTIYEAGM
ncbi:hypothetical protein Msil_2786 [Methylocella silvestris BL2]|uniref:DUF4347 domain-containing protein n=1 Tax=Methylocella silvestris (strain DSM 15510 / CIP 108128 / LMG 27833 / NCIMB 13906 / BL2) TaxID=395965 RepID=B8ES07_METSB|nr:hypothetical protein [Methylocella silvestris]ACK51705.1 hypothetical protein Msil_2786 [Methylocella silvestris BL2]